MLGAIRVGGISSEPTSAKGEKCRYRGAVYGHLDSSKRAVAMRGNAGYHRQVIGALASSTVVPAGAPARTNANCTRRPILQARVMAKNWTMGLDQPFLQLILNVIMTTVATSLALICHMLKQENQRLTAELHLRNEQAPSLSIPKAQQEIGSEPGCAPVVNAAPPLHTDVRPDIREFVKLRSQDWMANGIVSAEEAQQ